MRALRKKEMKIQMKKARQGSTCACAYAHMRISACARVRTEEGDGDPDEEGEGPYGGNAPDEMRRLRSSQRPPVERKQRQCEQREQPHL